MYQQSYGKSSPNAYMLAARFNGGNGMKHFPIYLDLSDRTVIVSGAGSTAVPKLRLLLKTPARIHVFGQDAHRDVELWAAEGRLRHFRRPVATSDVEGAGLLYCAANDADEDARVAKIGRCLGVGVNVVDNLEASDFITPAIVDRSPVTIAIGTEGAAPVLARKLKAEIERRLPQSIGTLARIGKTLRPRIRDLPSGRARRKFWEAFYSESNLWALAGSRQSGIREILKRVGDRQVLGRGRVSIVGAGPGDPDLLTLRARSLLSGADVVIHDRLVPEPVLEVARREAEVIDAGKAGFGRSWKQDDINALMIRRALQGNHVVRLKSGDPVVFSRLDEETEALTAAGIEWQIIPGITAASAAAAVLGSSLTRRLRNSEVRLMTGHDVDGFTEQDWSSLSRPGTVGALYMSRQAARFFCGRMLMHGARGSTPVSIVSNASRPDQRVVSTTLLGLPAAMTKERIDGPTILLLGLPEAGTARAERGATACDATSAVSTSYSPSRSSLDRVFGNAGLGETSALAARRPGL